MILNAAEIQEELRQKGLEMAESIFETDAHPDQMQATPENFQKLKSLDVNSILYQVKDDNEPIAWVVVMPTQRAVAEKFITGTINEQEFLDNTEPAESYDAVYICAAATLPEYRRKGVASDLVKTALYRLPLKVDYEIYSWPTSAEGAEGLKKLGQKTGKVIHTRHE
jgi:hypothetical protein